jgi:hypothetical protein
MVSVKKITSKYIEKRRLAKKKEHNKYLKTLYPENLWISFKKIMDMDHKKNLLACATLEEQENYLNGIDSLFRQYAASYKIPRKVIDASDAYKTLCQLTRFNVYSNKYRSSINLRINQLEMCAIRKTTSKRAFSKNKLILKRELTCVEKAHPDDDTKSKWDWVDTKYYKHLETNSLNTTNKWVPAKKWTLEVPSS